MPLSNYFRKSGKRGKGSQVLKKMQAKYGKKRGTAVFYGKVNNMRKGTKKERRAQPKSAPGSKKGKKGK